MNYIKIGAKAIKLHAQDSSKKKNPFVWQGNLCMGKTISPAAMLSHKEVPEEMGLIMFLLHVPPCEIQFFYIFKFSL